MLFSSTVFLFYFLPIVLLLYFVSVKIVWLKNLILLFASLIFYAWGEPIYVLLMLLSICINYIIAMCVNSSHKLVLRKFFLILSIVANLLIIGYYKYADFIINNINDLLNLSIENLNIPLPIGISFFTFQAMSYVIDVYRGDGECQKNPLNVALYISLFPQLIAGPIVRYQTIADQIMHRKETVSDFACGIRIFFCGLAKKVLLSNTFGLIADQAFVSVSSNSLLFSWLGIISYTLQIFFDFSGYSDMAIGLGRMFGFHFLPNFNYPYISKSVTDFWRRWHMSLGQWFRDYVYIPLGGSRVSTSRQFINISIVWLLTGIWHGANWTFIFWGIYYGILLIVEKKFLLNYLKKTRIIPHIYSTLIVLVGWVFFRSTDLTEAFNYLRVMFGFSGNSFIDNNFWIYFSEYKLYFIIGIIASTPLISILCKKATNFITSDHSIILRCAVLGASTIIFSTVIIATISMMISSTYNPFIYFNF